MYIAPSQNKLHKILSEGRKFKTTKKQVLQTSIDRPGLSVVISGIIKRYIILNDGTTGIQILYGPGDVFPLTQMFKTLFNQEIYFGLEVYYYESMCPAEIRFVEDTQLISEVKKDPLIYADLLQEAGKHLASCVQKLENIELRASHKRLAHELVYLSRRFGRETSKGIEIDAPITHQVLADSLSLTRETVSAATKELRQRKLIGAGRNLLILDIKKLEEMAHE